MSKLNSHMFTIELNVSGKPVCEEEMICYTKEGDEVVQEQKITKSPNFLQLCFLRVKSS